MHDIIIVGGGIAGLRVGIKVLRENPDADVLILEKYDYIGGRVITHYKGGNQWEIGAGRISSSHTRVLELIDHYRLTWTTMAESAEWRSRGIIRPDRFAELAKIYIDPLRSLSPSILRNQTISTLLEHIHGQNSARKFMEQFPYWSELYTLRADLALVSFSDEMESWRGFGTCREGLSAIIRGMVREFKYLGGTVHVNTDVVDVIRRKGGEHVICKEGNEYAGHTVVLALHRDAVASMKHLSTWHVLRHLKMNPLLRIYAVFPKKAGKVWFADLPKTVTDSRLRFVIPVNPKKGTIMVSYTDGADAKYWLSMKSKRGIDAVQEEIMTEIRRVFSEISDIPDPIEFKFYPWYNGCTYWLPGNYDANTMSNDALCIRPSLFCCGESFSLRQAWMEGALEHADMLLEDKRFRERLFIA